MLLADQDGVVHSSIPGLAHTARVPLDVCHRSILKFMEPDPFSGTKDLEGRRIEPVEGGWKLVNYLKYREMMNADEQRERARLRQQAKRERDKITKNVTLRHAPSRSVTDVTTLDVDVDVDVDVKELKSKSLVSRKRSTGTRIPENFVPTEQHYLLGKELGIIVDMEFQKFRDYYLGISGSRGVRLDWNAAFRSWMRNSLNYGDTNDRRVGKREQRIADVRANQEAILVGLGFGTEFGRDSADIQASSSSGGNPSVAKRLLGN